MKNFGTEIGICPLQSNQHSNPFKIKHYENEIIYNSSQRIFRT